MKWTLASVGVLWAMLMACPVSSADTPASAPPTSPAASADTPPASQPPQPQPQPQPGHAAPPANEAEAWLDRIEAASRKVTTLDARLRYELVQGAMGDKQVRAGSLFYDATPPAKFAIHFDRLLAGRRLIREDRWYVFDGQWLAEKIVDQKQFIKRQFTPPPGNAPGSAPASAPASAADQPAGVSPANPAAQGQASPSADTPQPTAVNPLADGSGPFALPLTLQRNAVVKKYRVALIDAADSDPAGTIHLRLIPHVARRGEFTQIDLWYHKDTLLPVRAETLDETENHTAILLSSLRQGQPIDAKMFDTTPPAASEGWTVEIKPLESPDATPSP